MKIELRIKSGEGTPEMKIQNFLEFFLILFGLFKAVSCSSDEARQRADEERREREERERERREEERRRRQEERERQEADRALFRHYPC